MTSAVAPARTGHDTVPLNRLLRAELRWIFRRPRTLLVLGMLAAIPVVIGVALTLVDPSADGAGPDDSAGPLLTAAVGNAYVLPIASLTMTLALLLRDGGRRRDRGRGSARETLRGWLLAPVSRGRLLGVKAFGVATVSLVAVLSMATTATITGLAINGTDALFTISGSTLSLPEALGRVLITVAWVTLQLWAVGAVALAISAWTEHPMLVVVAVLAGDVVFTILTFLSAVKWLHPFLLTQNWSSALTETLQDPMPSGQLAEGALRAACYIVIALSLAYSRLTTRDG